MYPPILRATPAFGCRGSGSRRQSRQRDRDRASVPDRPRRRDDVGRSIVLLQPNQGLTQAEVGQLIGKHKDTVRDMWADARVKLARYLAAFQPAG